MPDTGVVNIIKININSIVAEDARDSKSCANMQTALETEPKQKTDIAEKCYTDMDSISKLRENNTKPMIETQSNGTMEYFLLGPPYESNKKKSADVTEQIHIDFNDAFNGIGYFEGTSSLQLKPGSKPYQVLLRHVAYAHQKPFQEELGRLQKPNIIVPLGIDESALCWCPKLMVQ